MNSPILLTQELPWNLMDLRGHPPAGHKPLYGFHSHPDARRVLTAEKAAGPISPYGAAPAGGKLSSGPQLEAACLQPWVVLVLAPEVLRDQPNPSSHGSPTVIWGQLEWRSSDLEPETVLVEIRAPLLSL